MAGLFLFFHLLFSPYLGVRRSSQARLIAALVDGTMRGRLNPSQIVPVSTKSGRSRLVLVDSERARHRNGRFQRSPCQIDWSSSNRGLKLPLWSIYA